MLIEITVLEAYQVQAALEDRLTKLEADPTEADSLEAMMVRQGLTYTGSVHAKLLVLLYGEDEPDEATLEEWLNREGQPEFKGAFG